MGIFDEGCMGMYNAIFDDEYINPLGIFKERLSQSALYYRMTTVSDEEARGRLPVARRSRHDASTSGTDSETELTEDQILEQCKMYIAALRIADDFGCAGIGIQYQQGLKDLVPGFRPGRGPAQRAGAPAGLRRGRPRALSRASPCPTSTRSTGAAAWTR